MSLKKFRSSLKELFVPLEGGGANELLRSTIFYSPVLSPLVLFAVTGFDHVYEKWLNAFVISLVVSYTCMLAAFIARKLEPPLMRALKRPLVEHTRGWWLSLTMCVMPLGIFLGFKANSLVCRLLGIEGADLIGVATAADYRVGLIIGTIIALTFFQLRSRHETRERNRLHEVRIKALESESLQAQLAALTAQMNPHLMFNALNTVAALVPSDPAKAENTIVKLSELYRGVLNSSRNSVHSLATELEICSAYLDVEKARFGERLQSRITIAPDLDAGALEIPALCLQPLVENAIKHGISPKANGGEVRISAARVTDGLELEVIDDGIGFAAAQSHRSKGAGSALRNCAERLRLKYDGRGSFGISERPEGGTVVRLVLPLFSEARA